MITQLDTMFLTAVEAGDKPESGFRHRDHIRLAWIYLLQSGLEEGARKIEQTIRIFAEKNGVPQLYHHTITWFWAKAVDEAIRNCDNMDFESFAAENSYLLDKNYIYRFFSRERLATLEAKTGWVEPDCSAGFQPAPEAEFKTSTA